MALVTRKPDGHIATDGIRRMVSVHAGNRNRWSGRRRGRPDRHNHTVWWSE